VSEALCRITAAGDSAIVVEFEERIDPAVSAHVIALAASIRAAALDGVRDVVPTYRSVAVFFDPLRTDYDDLVARLERAASRPAPAAGGDRPALTVPVCYGGEFGPDLAEVSSFAHMSEQDVVELHTATSYRVFMLGFLPGFPYLGVVDFRIAMPRRATPRVRVPAGSVGIAGAQTGIYPLDAPGGWRLIGRTPLSPFDERRPDPFLMKPGETVRFRSIDRVEFARIAAHGGGG
jgi:inhibitor of KinA